MVPLGSVEYDGQTLPLISPDGRFLAVQMGTPPPWDLVLSIPSRTGEPPAPWAGVRLAVYEWVDSPPRLARREVPGGLPPGALLGRGTDEHGFLIEVPRADGARAVARVAWPGGGAAPNGPAAAVEWLLDDGHLNTDAVLIDGERLLVARPAPLGADALPGRGAGAHPFELASFGGGPAGGDVADGGGPPVTLALPGRALRFPLVSPDRRRAACFAVDTAGMAATEVVVVGLDAGGLSVQARHPAGVGVGLAGAYQGAAGMEALPPREASGLLHWLGADAAGLRTLVGGDPAAMPVCEPGSLARVDVGGGRVLVATAADVRLRRAGAGASEGAGVEVWGGPGLPRGCAVRGRVVMLGAGPVAGVLKVAVVEFGE